MKKQYIDALDGAVNILKSNLSEFTHKFMESNSNHSFYLPSENVEWTTGFCTGQYWLAYEYTKDVCFKEAAFIQTDSFMDRIQKRVDVDHHDMGFLYTPSCVAAWKLCESKTGRDAAILAADNLMSRFQEKGEFFQAWGEIGVPENYRLIIDCLLNLPLLYWASDVTGNPDYREKAVAHTKTSLKNLIRPDHSTYHTYFFDCKTGEPLRGVTHQGYRDNSAWARGQAWGIYGIALAYKYTLDESCFDLFEKTAGFYIEHLPQDYVPYWDLSFSDGSDEPKDSSAAAIAACGMLEMAKYLEKSRADYYKEQARKTADALIKTCAVSDQTISNGLLLHGVYAKSSPYNPVTDRGVDECNTWGDYFFMELLMRLTKDWDTYW
ncbi:glycoside hydrolase family 88 protein [Lachnospiraceae bacterium OttesenSCG-928-D06]|nr:glycoside hydrolase family 88 protein [Lachnospiraceae bacterium OttesenSCG-928-D06]